MYQTTIPVVIAAAGLALTAFLVLVWRGTRGYLRGARGYSSGARGYLRDASSAKSPAFYPAEACAASSAGDSPLQRYQPLFRLLAGRDAEFLRHNRQCPQAARRWEKAARHWERSQRRIVRLYLKELARDFHCLHREARILMAQSPEQYSHLWRVLWMQQLAFWRALIWIEIRLSLRPIGTPAINCEALAGAFEASVREISRSAAAPSQLA